ncbi:MULTISPECIES: DUF5806 family protein [Halorubrum]|uniref:Uncharacterized protein n=1 Tax=Halorubrum sodomense TaxID=35743 RepID=A0A1I6FLB8_HALSD|nr:MULTISPECIES: DUF5806 family protein [Halorubrum]TKX56049.1 hypothetical protein EXE42_00365 [Halorubrum sp. SP3]TKX71067.1 hypothetical protein EXE45_02270 [Halorubrum sp. SP9]SFR30739.1 hypothetical protein SAMN04487937_0567 [Halorubrum sodomense]
MSDHTGPAAEDADGTGDSAADRSPAEGDRDPGPRPGDETNEETPTADSDATDEPNEEAATDDGPDDADDVPRDVRKYERFKKMDGARYERVNEFLRDRTYVTAREWAIARLCADFRTETGVEMTKIGENLPQLVPFMTDTYTPQAVNQARYSFEEKVTKAGATFLYGAMSGFFTAEDLDEMMYEVTEVAKFLLEVEGVDLAVADELEAEDKISEVMREVRASSADLRGEEVRCPECGHVHSPTEE